MLAGPAFGPDEAHWPVTPAPPLLGAADVHVWRVALPVSTEQLHALAAGLSADEQARAARFARVTDRSRFLAAHAALRRILAGYLHVSPEQVGYVAGPQGKPSLAPELAGRPLHFNLAHSGDLALVAISLGREVGVDVEQLRPMPDLDSIAERYFSPDERRALAGLPAEERPAAFFNIWTDKEAFIKAIGQGLGYPLDQFTVALRPAGLDRPVLIKTEAAQPWGLRSLAPGRGYVGAVVSAGLKWNLVRWQFR